jgi:proline racemase/trans-L-3-hydroxyproline dehydratase
MVFLTSLMCNIVTEFTALIPVISCSDAHITGFNHIIAEEDDKLKNGFISW